MGKKVAGDKGGERRKVGWRGERLGWLEMEVTTKKSRHHLRHERHSSAGRGMLYKRGVFFSALEGHVQPFIYPIEKETEGPDLIEVLTISSLLSFDRHVVKARIYYEQRLNDQEQKHANT